VSESTFTRTDERWPALPLDEWQDTCDTLHLWTQIVGKVQLELRPPLNQLWQVALHPTPRGLTTGRIPFATGAFSIAFDFVDHNLAISTSDGRTSLTALRPRSVADFYRAFMRQLEALHIDVSITARPDEMPDPIPFAEDEQHRSYDRDAVERWWRIVLQTTLVLDRYRALYAGKSSPVLFWWGSFDLNVARFSGRPAPLLTGVPHFMRLAEDQENVATGFWPGNASASGIVIGEPCFFAYSYPEPPGFKEASVRPGEASYHAQLGEFVLPYHAIRTLPDPGQSILDFFVDTYEAAASRADWRPLPVLHYQSGPSL
jgi:hypothetical protein